MATATTSQTAQGKIILTISARRHRRRFVVALAGKEARLRPSSLEVLLHLVKARLQGQLVFRDKIQPPGSGGLRLVSELRRDMESALDPSMPLTDNDQHGHYSLDESITVGEVNTTMLETIDERGIPKLAREIRSLLEEKATSDGKD